MAVCLSKLTSKAQTVIPREIRVHLDLKPGDVVRYRTTPTGIMIDKLPSHTADDTLIAFTEWASRADDHAYQAL